MKSFAAWIHFLLPFLAIALAIPFAFAADPPRRPPSAVSVMDAGLEAGTAGLHSVHPTLSGLAPLPNDQRVPKAWLPPGAFDPDTGPSDIIYPAQQITIRFNHKLHLTGDVGATCKTCHSLATKSESTRDSLTPKAIVCDACHNTSHEDLAKVTPGDDEKGQCAFCHVGYKKSDGNRVAPMRLPTPNMIFNHKKHADRNIQCAQCHGSVGELELATRDQLPRMRGCFGCHQMADSAARGEAKSACETCHFRAPTPEQGRIQNLFASGRLTPPRWLHNAAHTPDFIERHKWVAGNDSQFCSNCHSENYCTACHDGRIRPRSIHPNDYLSMHAIEARQATQKCASCHQEQSFCLQCHQRLGVTMSGPSDVRNAGRFHPPKSIWSDAPRKPGHHAMEAQRNLSACVSCHIERDCVVCHGGRGVGAGFNPHRGGFAGGCATQFRRNPRPCYACHQPDDASLNLCR